MVLPSFRMVIVTKERQDVSDSPLLTMVNVIRKMRDEWFYHHS